MAAPNRRYNLHSRASLPSSRDASVGGPAQPDRLDVARLASAGHLVRRLPRCAPLYVGTAHFLLRFPLLSLRFTRRYNAPVNFTDELDAARADVTVLADLLQRAAPAVRRAIRADLPRQWQQVLTPEE